MERTRDRLAISRGQRSMEARLKRLVTVLAFLSSFAALIVVAGGGLALFAIEVSGERGMGALLALCSGVAFAAVMALIFAREGLSAKERGRRSASRRRSWAQLLLRLSPSSPSVSQEFHSIAGCRCSTGRALGRDLLWPRGGFDSVARPSPLAGDHRGRADRRPDGPYAADPTRPAAAAFRIGGGSRKPAGGRCERV